jgi:predicted nucleic acid-binding protein
VRVAETAAATARCQPAIAVVTQVVKQVACRNVKDLCSNRNANNQVVAVMARAIRSLAMQTTMRDVARVIAQVQQRVQRSIRDEDYIAAATTVSA